MAIGATGQAGRFAISQKRTYASYAEIYRNKVKQAQESAVANAANVMFGAIASESAGLFQIAIVQATNRAREQIVAKVADITA